MIDFNNLSKNPVSHWQYRGTHDFEVPIGAFGFIYSIEQIDPTPGTKYKYIGRKYLTASKTTTKKVLLKSGVKKTQKKKSRVESGWRDYTGSCIPLNAQIEKLGKEAFKFEILEFSKTKGQCNFLEVFFQMRANVLGDDSYFNDAVGSGMFRGVKFDNDFKKLLSEIKI